METHAEETRDGKTRRVAEALITQFKESISKIARKPFEETGVTLPRMEIWEAYAIAAIKACE